MAYVNYKEVGKEVLVAGIAGTAGIAAHFMFLQPQFAGQEIIPGVQTTTIVDIIIAFIIGVVTTMYARSGLGKIAGYGLSAVFFGLGLAQQFGLMAVPTIRMAPTPRPMVGTSGVPRASYLAPPGVVVNKHGSVPEIAPGTFA